MILHIPHSSTKFPPREEIKVSEDAVLSLTDWYADELFLHEHSERIVFDYSRFFCDVERFNCNKKETMSKIGMGVVYSHDNFKNRIRDIEEKEVMRIISEYYIPYHKKFNDIVEIYLSYFKGVVVVDCHSFYDENKTGIDFCLGVNEDSSVSKELIQSLKESIIDNGYSVKINNPFVGSIVPSNFIGDSRVKSLMIEVNKSLYLKNNGLSNEKRNFYQTRDFIRELLNIVDLYERNLEKE